MPETRLGLPEGSLFVRHTVLDPHRPTLLFIHGLGESRLCFDEAFEPGRLPGFNMVVPDLLGYGRSSAALHDDYSFDSQVRRLGSAVEELDLRSIFIVGHSLGGDLGTLMAASREEKRVRGLVNVEGNLTPSDAFISGGVVAAEEHGDFIRWFRNDFMEKLVLETWGKSWASCRRYYASLGLCRPEAFLANAKEAYERSKPLPGMKESSIGRAFAELEIPKAFCWGAESLSAETQRLLQDSALPNHRIDGAFHWPMIDRPELFYGWLGTFLPNCRG